MYDRRRCGANEYSAQAFMNGIHEPCRYGDNFSCADVETESAQSTRRAIWRRGHGTIPPEMSRTALRAQITVGSSSRRSCQ
jgi:hypothetical protein